MPITSTIENGCIVHRVRGTVNPDDFIVAIENRHTLPNYRSTMNVIWHFQELNEQPLKFMDIHSLVSRVTRCMTEQHISNIKIALVGESDLTYGIVRMYESLAEINMSNQYKVFRNFDMAAAWAQDLSKHTAPLQQRLNPPV